jgi:uncharacterized membrane protein
LNGGTSEKISQPEAYGMVEIVKKIAAVVATCSEFTAVIVILAGAIQAIASVVAPFIQGKTFVAPLVVFRGFAGWLVLALEFLLAADILRTAISPTWNDIGQLAAIAAIRTFLNYSLSHDLRYAPGSE